TTFAALVDCLVTTPFRLPSVYIEQPLGCFRSSLPAAVGIALAIGMRATQRSRAIRHVLGLVKLVFGIAALKASWEHDLPMLLGTLPPFLWLAALPRVDGKEDARPELPRLLLAWVAVLQPLQAYPVAGSQAYFGTVLHVLAGAVCLDDGLR